MKKNYDKLFLAVLAVIIAALFGWQRLSGKDGAYAVVTQYGEKIGTYSLYKTLDITIETKDGHSNTLSIENGQVRMAQADCPDGLCIKQGHISKNGQSIICLPHELTVEIISGEASMIDAVSE